MILHKILRYNSFLIIVLFLWFLPSCDKEKEFPTEFVNKSDLEYCDYEVGSYWIYREENTGQLDTFKVLHRERSIIDDTKYVGSFRETVVLSCKSTLHQGHPDYIESSIVINAFNGGVYVELHHHYDGETLVLSSNDIYINNLQHDNFKLQSTLDSLNVINKDYFDIKIFEHKSGPENALFKIKWSKHIGIICYEYFDASKWQLIEHQSIQ